jgi:hypothetical protein
VRFKDLQKRIVLISWCHGKVSLLSFKVAVTKLRVTVISWCHGKVSIPSFKVTVTKLRVVTLISWCHGKVSLPSFKVTVTKLRVTLIRWCHGKIYLSSFKGPVIRFRRWTVWFKSQCSDFTWNIIRWLTFFGFTTGGICLREARFCLPFVPLITSLLKVFLSHSGRSSLLEVSNCWRPQQIIFANGRSLVNAKRLVVLE